MHPLAFLCETYETERLKTLSVWTQFADGELAFRPEPRLRTPHEQMVHQCASEEGWMRLMLGIDVGIPVLPEQETVRGFVAHYAAQSAARAEALALKPDGWFTETTQFFEVPRSRAWVLVRRIAHSAHHRGQLTVLLRLLGKALYSTYGPTADTGGLPANGAKVIYRYESVEELLREEQEGGRRPVLPGTGAAPVTERPGA